MPSLPILGLLILDLRFKYHVIPYRDCAKRFKYHVLPQRDCAKRFKYHVLTQILCSKRSRSWRWANGTTDAITATGLCSEGVGSCID